MRRLLLGVVLLGAGAVLLVVLLRHPGGSSARAAKPQSFLQQAGQLPAPQQPAFKVGRPRLLDRHERIARFAPVRRPAEARSPTTGS